VLAAHSLRPELANQQRLRPALGQLAPVLGPATSASAVRRTLNLASDRVLVRIAQAGARIRAHVWQQIQDAGGFPWLEIAGKPLAG
jgi:hypothetical protein